MERYHATRGNGNHLAGLRVATRTGRLVSYLEIADAGQFDFFATGQGLTDLLEECINDVLGFAFIEADPLEQKFGELSLRQCTLYCHVEPSSSVLMRAGVRRVDR